MPNFVNRPNKGVGMTLCYYCGKPNAVVLDRHIVNHSTQIGMIHNKVVDMQPCSECEDYMKQGILLITIDDEKSPPEWDKQAMPNPYRTGGFFVVTEEACKRCLPDDLYNWASVMRWMFIAHDAAEAIGLFALAEGEA